MVKTKKFIFQYLKSIFQLYHKRIESKKTENIMK